MGEYFPARLCIAVTVHHIIDLLSIDSHHDTLTAELLRRLAHKLRGKHCRRINRHFIRARIEQITNIANSANAAAHGQRHKYRLRHTFNRLISGISAMMGRGNVQKGNLIRPLLIVAPRYFDRIACIPDIHKLHALDHAAIVHIQAWNDTFC